MGEGDESNSVCGAREGLCQKGCPRASQPSLCVMGGGPERARDMPEVTQHIRGTASTRIQVSWGVDSALGLGEHWLVPSLDI